MKTFYSYVASTVMLVATLSTMNAQNLSGSTPGWNDRQDHDRSNEIDFGGMYNAGEPNQGLAEEQEQGYSHGIDYRSESNSLNMLECVNTRYNEQNRTGRASTAVVLLKPKYVAMSNVLSFSNQEAEAFFPVYARYESELYALTKVVTDPEGLRDRQQILKERFFEEMDRKSGSYLASRFLAWENYYAITCAIK